MWRHLSAVVVVALCLFAHASARTLKKRQSASQRYIETGPDNTAVVLNSNNGVTLTCRVPSDDTTSRVQWFEYGTNPSGSIVSDGILLLPGHPNSIRYSLDLTNPGQYDLHINPIVAEDGTYYKCQDANAAPPDQTELGAQLVVIEAVPNCTTTMTSPIVVEGDYHTMECVMYFRASLGVEPLITWTGPEPFLTASSVTNVSVWSGISFTVQRNMDALSYAARTNFTQKGFNSPNSASNIPTWSSTWRSPQILVHWGPKNMYISPDQTDYDVGTTITCFADAFPAATIYWQNLDTAEIWNSQSFVVRADLVGTNRFRCHAENYINGVLYYNDLFNYIVVNPIPTTPIPGPSTTTTLPPAEAYCSDLSGRWQSDSPKATLCLWVDFTMNGVVTGLLKNDTDTFWHDIYGRVQVNTFDQGGFTTVSPGTVGVTAYVLECKACFGVESMTVSQIQRSEASATTCGDPGVSNILPDFKFYRVANTSPCNSAPPA
jgi:hypothetical protein